MPVANYVKKNLCLFLHSMTHLLISARAADVDLDAHVVAVVGVVFPIHGLTEHRRTPPPEADGLTKLESRILS